MRFTHRLTVYIVTLGLVVGLYPGILIGHAAASLKIGVLMDMTGPMYLEPELVLDWAAGLVNEGGGINGRKVELVYLDTGSMDIETAGEELVQRDDVMVVIGPETSDDAFRIAPLFIENKKLLISPTATSDDLFRAFGGLKYFWRTVPGDAAQARMILHILEQRGADRLSLIYQASTYGKTYLSWLPFFAIERGIEIDLVEYREGMIEQVVDEAVANNPDYIVVGAYAPEAVEIKRELDRRTSPIRLFLTDGSQTGTLIEDLGNAAEGLEGTAPSYDIDSGFRQAFIQRYGKEPLSYAASIWDAFYLAVCALARYEYKSGGEWIEYSVKSVIAGRGVAVSWNDIDRAVCLIGEGSHPNLEGASIDLSFDEEYGLDPVQGYYAHWVVHYGTFLTNKVIGLDDIDTEMVSQGMSISRGTVSTSLEPLSLLSHSSTGATGERSGLQVVILASTAGWGNYRHQSDALAVYNLLRRNGVRDDAIVFLSADDIPLHEQNPLPGVVRHESGGSNIRSGAEIDYSSDSVCAATFLRVLRGEKTAGTPVVLEADSSTDVLLYIVGHGKKGEIPFDCGPSLAAEELLSVLNELQARSGFRRMLVMTELCYGESVAENLVTPDVLYLTAASSTEQSFGTNYDPELETWVADDFSWKALKLIARHPSMFLTDLFTRLYSEVSGSHVRMVNAEHFAGLRSTPLSDFFTP